MSGKMNWKKVREENLVYTHGASSIKIDKTSTEASPANSRTAHDLAQNNPVFRKLLRDLQSGKFGKTSGEE